MSPTRAPLRARATARFTAVVDLPTPPLPAPTATMLRMPGTAWRPKPPRARTSAVIFARATCTPGSAATFCSASAFIWSRTGQAGVVSSIVKSTSPAAMRTSFTKPRLTMSLCRSGSWTVRRAASTCSWLTLNSPVLPGRSAGRSVGGEGGVHGLLELLELVRRRAEDRGADNPLAVDHEGSRKPLVGLERLLELVVPQQLPVGNPVLSHEVLDLLGLARLENDADDFDALGLVLAPELGVVGQLLQARTAPGRPEVEHHHPALERGQADPAARQVRQLERRRCPHLRHRPPAGPQRPHQEQRRQRPQPPRTHPIIICICSP